MSTSNSPAPPLAEDHKLLGRLWELPYSTGSNIHSAADLKSAYYNQDANFAYVVKEVILEEINLYNRLENIKGWGFPYSDRMVRCFLCRVMVEKELSRVGFHAWV
jgi:hypothetical protein